MRSLLLDRLAKRGKRTVVFRVHVPVVVSWTQQPELNRPARQTMPKARNPQLLVPNRGCLGPGYRLWADDGYDYCA